MEVWKVGKTFLIHHSSSMLWEMTVSNITCMKTEYIRLKHAKWWYGPLISCSKPLNLPRESDVFNLDFSLIMMFT
ncbi:hypothetical protein LDENG_00262530 [Lucifuga dentata]|nr:hypothetical protein LDENG_00262530 [Lucifuga dentata]